MSDEPIELEVQDLVTEQSAPKAGGPEDIYGSNDDPDYDEEE